MRNPNTDYTVLRMLLKIKCQYLKRTVQGERPKASVWALAAASDSNTTREGEVPGHGGYGLDSNIWSEPGGGREVFGLLKYIRLDMYIRVYWKWGTNYLFDVRIVSLDTGS